MIKVFRYSIQCGLMRPYGLIELGQHWFRYLRTPTHDINQCWHIDGVVQDCSISSALALQILQSCTKPLISSVRTCGTYLSQEIKWNKCKNYTFIIRATVPGDQCVNSAQCSCPFQVREFPMKMSWHENIFLITGPLWGESTGYQWIPLTKGQ